MAKVFQSSPVAMAITTLAEGRYVEVNDGFLSQTGCRREEVIGRTTVELGIWAHTGERQDMVRAVRGR